MEDQLMRQACADIINDLLQNPLSRPFRKKVDAKKLGLDDYPVLVKKPMDLGTISAKLQNNQYVKVGDPKLFDYNGFASDVRLVFDNCSTYYRKGSDIYNSGIKLNLQFGKAWGVFLRRFRPDEVNVDDEDGYNSDDSYQPPPTLDNASTNAGNSGLLVALQQFGSRFGITHITSETIAAPKVDQNGVTRKGSLSAFARLSSRAREQFRESIQVRAKNQRLVPALTPEQVAAKFDCQERITKDQAVNIVTRVTKIFTDEPNMLELEAIDGPAVIIGDLHGQYWDMRHMLRVSTRAAPDPRSVPVVDGEALDDANSVSVDEQGTPLKFVPAPNTTYIFLGDYVDRGAFSCEILLYLFALKVAYPKQVYMVRGNHECDAVASYFGFKRECDRKYGRQVYNASLTAFCAMPIAATLDTMAGTLLCCHGGLSPNIESLEVLRDINRFQEPGVSGALCDVLWSDPVKDDDMVPFVNEAEVEREKQVFREIDYFRNSTRGCSYRYGFHATDLFLAKNKLVGLVRAHEVQEQGYRYHFNKIQKKGDSWERVVVTVFSAPNYCERYQNRAAFLRIGTRPNEGFASSSVPQASTPLQQVGNRAPVKEQKKQRRTRRGFFGGGNKKQTRKSVRKSGAGPKPVQLGTNRKSKGGKFGISSLLQIVQFDAVPHPSPAHVENETFQLFELIGKNCPYMPSTSSGFMMCALALGREYGDATERNTTNKEIEEDAKKTRPGGPTKEESLRGARSKMKRAYLKISVVSVLRKLVISAFEVAKASDEMNEKHPMVVEDLMEDLSLRFLQKQESRKHLQQPTDNKGTTSTAAEHSKNGAADTVAPAEHVAESLQDSTVLRRYQDIVAENIRISTFQGRERTVSEVNHTALDAAVETNLLQDLAAWLSVATGYQVPADDTGFYEELRDGVVLCSLLIQIPGSGINTYHAQRPLKTFKARENMLEVQQACDRLKIVYTIRQNDLNKNCTGAFVSCLVNILNYLHNVDANLLAASSKPASESRMKGVNSRTTKTSRNKRHSDNCTSKAQHHPQSPQRNSGEFAEQATKPRPSLLSYRKPKGNPAPARSSIATLEHRQASARIHQQLSGTSLVEITPIENGVVGFSKRELMALELLFLLVDSNSDGKIDAAELVNWSREDPTPTSTSRANECIKAVDSDGDGLIGQDDFLNFAAQLKELWLLDEEERAEQKNQKIEK